MNHLSYIEVSREALVHNLSALRTIAPAGQEFVAVVKGNAYGHGMREVVAALYGNVEGFQVDDLDELRELRHFCDARALVYGYVPISQIEEAVWSEYAEITVYDRDQLSELDRIRKERGGARPLLFSLKIDALLGRQGLLPDEVDGFLEELARYPDLRPVSAYAHYANIEDTTDLTHAEAQEEVFEAAFAKLRAQFPAIRRHFSATSGLLTRPIEGHCIVRAGIGLYGLYPSAPLARSHTELALRPVLRWVSHLAQVKTLPAGHPVGYGLTYRTTRPTKVGIVPQGYSDGYDRGLSSVGEVLVHGTRCPVIGRIAMNMFAIDLSPVPDAVAEDEVVLLGTQGHERITAEEIAAKLGTINYEVVARISPLLPRVIA